VSRSVKKGPYVAQYLLKKIEQMNASGTKRVVRTWARASIWATMVRSSRPI